jgi:hypothetical protein
MVAPTSRPTAHFTMHRDGSITQHLPLNGEREMRTFESENSKTLGIEMRSELTLQSALDRHDKLLGDLSDLTHGLAEKLEPILVPEFEGEALSAGQDRPQVSHFTTRVENFNDQLETAIARLNVLYRRVDF